VKVRGKEKVLDDKTAENIKKVLMRGKECTITFQEPAAATSPTPAPKGATKKPAAQIVLTSPKIEKSKSSSKKASGAPQVVKESFMKKKGGTYKNWRERVFKLTTDHKLSYYENTFDENACGEINLREASKIEEDDSGSDWGITLKTKDRVWHFRCQQQVLRNEWIEEITKFMPHRQQTIFLKVMKEGKMYKSAAGMAFARGKVRWFRLLRNLEYWDSEECKIKKGEIMINDISMFEETQEGGTKDMPYGMKLHTQARTWSLYVETEDERDSWLKKIKNRRELNNYENVTVSDVDQYRSTRRD